MPPTCRIPIPGRSIADVELAIRTLTQLNADGTVASMGFMNMGAGPELLLLSLLGQDVYDDSVTPSVPDLSSPDLDNLLTVWAQMQADGLFNPPMTDDDEGDFFNPPLQMGRSSFTGGGPEDAEPKTPALLPGGHAGLDVNGFAISSGTQYPEEAYELVKFLSANPQVATSFIGSTPARRTLTGVQAENPGGLKFAAAQSPELAALLPVALDQAFPPSQMRFSEYLGLAIQQMVQNNVDARTALQTVEDNALTRLDTSSARRDTTQITVQTPLPTANLAPGEIALKFGISSMMSPLPNQDQWDAFAADFAARDPEVGRRADQVGLPGFLERYGG